MRVLTLAALIAVALTTAPVARATTADDVCDRAAVACVIDTPRPVDDQSVLDFGTRPLTLARRGSLDVGGGLMTIRAGSLTLAGGSALFARGNAAEAKPRAGSIAIVTLGGIVINSQSRIDLSAPQGGGFLDVTAGGNVEILGFIGVQGSSPLANGGRFTLNAEGSVRLVAPGEIRALGGGDGNGGGDVSILANRGRIEIGGPIDVSGRDGGSIILESETESVTTSTAGRLDGTARADFGDGGSVSIEAATDIRIDGAIAVQAEGGIDAGGTGGDIDIIAGGSLTLNGPLTQYGAAPDGEGGDSDLRANGGDLIQTAPIVSRGRGAEGSGGFIIMLAARQVIAGPIDFGGGRGGAGELSIEAREAVTLTGEIDGDNDAGIEAGVLTASAQRIAVRTNVHLNGLNEGPGGFLDLVGCVVDIQTGSRLSSSGGGGTNLLRAADTLTVAPSTIVTAAGGSNVFRYRNPLKPPVVQGSVTPPPSVLVDRTLPPCSGPQACGDGTERGDEECDDGNTLSCDGCSSSCQSEVCGNGRLDCHDECDEQNAQNGDGCDVNCRITGCGNGIRTDGEACDDGNSSGCDLCSPLCTVEACGNGVLDCGEDCDDGNTAAEDGCEPTCRIGALPSCGDNRLNRDEECDDDNTDACDGCSATCTREECGNLIIDCGEQCDDGNQRDGDGCDSAPHPELPTIGTCRRTGCGNGIPTPNTGEQCDDGNAVNGDGCNANCTFPGCGNGIVDSGELCDDGNRRACDGCTETCRTEVCGNGIVDSTGPGCENVPAKEECDDADRISGDGCDANCTPTACGNLIVTDGEACDDGNDFDNDGCSAACQVETMCQGGGQEPCVRCTRDTDCDPVGLCAGKQCVASACTSVAPVDCNDGNPATIDHACVLDAAGAPICRHTCLNDGSCNDGDECTDDQCVDGRCQHAPRTRSGSIVCPLNPTCLNDGGCGDGNDCTDDQCVDGRCQHAPRTRFAAVSCPLDGSALLIGTAPAEALDAKVRAKLGKLISAAKTKLTAAEQSLVTKKRTKLLRVVGKKVNGTLVTIAKAQLKGKIADALADQLIALLDPLPDAVRSQDLLTP